MKYTFLFGLALLITSTAYSQSKTTDSLLFTFPKNEVGVNVAPHLSYMLGGSVSQEVRFSFIYKRQLQQRLYLRISPEINLFNDFFNPEGYTKILNVTDSTIREQKSETRIITPGINLGLEYRIPSKKLQWLVGADLAYRADFVRREVFTTDYTFENTAFDVRKEFQNRTTNATYNSNYHYVGVVPSLGIWLPLGDKFSLASTVQYQAIFGFGEEVLFDRDFNPKRNTNQSFEFSMRNVLSDVVISYMF